VASLEAYQRKRRFGRTPEPSGGRVQPGGDRFVVQKHDARRLHYDFRLEIDGVLKSWAVPKGPSLSPADKRLAVQTEDHPLDYADFEGVIPEGSYGAGPVMLWDRGTFEAESPSGSIRSTGSPASSGRRRTSADLSASEQLERGELKFSLSGHKLRGSFVLVKLQRSVKGNEWLLIKHRDAAADPDWNIDEHDGSVLTGRTLEEIEEGAPARSNADSDPAPALLSGARRAIMPEKVSPTLATLVEKPFSDPEWLFEVKLDGERALAWVREGKLELRSRVARNITAQYPELAELPARLPFDEAVLDGEIVALDGGGRSDFERLQRRMHVEKPSAALVRDVPVIYYLFDLLYADGYDLREAPLEERKDLLRRFVRWGDPFRYSDHQVEHGSELFELAKRQGLEGIIGKRVSSPYPGARTSEWVKFKATREVDAAIGGWTAPRGSRQHFGALLLGLYDESDVLRYIGSVGTGFREERQRIISRKLQDLATDVCPFSPAPETREQPFWTEPKLVARVRYANWTGARQLRQPAFLGLRDDRDPGDCRLEIELGGGEEAVHQDQASGPGPDGFTPTRSSRGPALAGRVLSGPREIEDELFRGSAEQATVEIDGRILRLTNLNKVYFPGEGITKRELIAYYYRMAECILPFLRDRPLVLRRYPDGIEGQAFFQKEAGSAAPEWMETVDIESEGKRQRIRYFMAGDRAALLYLTNLGCIDHNPWSSRRDSLEEPDYVFFDLDPTAGTPFATVVRVAQAVLGKLQEAGLEVFIKTSGATGMHLWVPLERLYTYEQVRTFADIVGRLVARDLPGEVTAQRSVEKRPPGTVLVDAAQNALGRPLAAPYSVRAFPQAPVSAPIKGGELTLRLRPERLNLQTMVQRVERVGDLWADFWRSRQRLDEALERLASGNRWERGARTGRHAGT
jgi:bifunctional non-homologous end joining protein LigD